MDSIWTAEEIGRCVRNTVDECLAQVLADRPSASVSRAQQRELARLVESLSGLFLDIRLQSTQS